MPGHDDRRLEVAKVPGTPPSFDAAAVVEASAQQGVFVVRRRGVQVPNYSDEEGQ